VVVRIPSVFRVHRPSVFVQVQNLETLVAEEARRTRRELVRDRDVLRVEHVAHLASPPKWASAEYTQRVHVSVLRVVRVREPDVANRHHVLAVALMLIAVMLPAREREVVKRHAAHLPRGVQRRPPRRGSLRRLAANLSRLDDRLVLALPRVQESVVLGDGG